eukprot:890242-Rhodomonas_salina.1
MAETGEQESKEKLDQALGAIKPGERRYLPTLSAYAICLRYLPTLSAYAICLLYLPTSAYSICLLYLPTLSAYSICLLYLPMLSVYSICLLYLPTISAYYICLLYLPMNICPEISAYAAYIGMPTPAAYATSKEIYLGHLPKIICP